MKTTEVINKSSIWGIRLKNFRALKDVELKDIPNFCVFVGAHGVGKTTIFSVFNFLKSAMEKNVTAALGELGGGKGLREVRTRGENGDIEIEIKFRSAEMDRRVTYKLVISEKDDRPYVKTEQLSYRRGGHGTPWRFLDFHNGKGLAITDKVDWREVQNDTELDREEQQLRSPDLLAIKALAQFEKFPAVVEWGQLIENWQVFDFHIQAARGERHDKNYAEFLDKNGSDLALVIDFLNKRHPQVLGGILNKLPARIPDIESVKAELMDDERVLLSFTHKSFAEPVRAQYISDGTMRMLAYLVLLYHPHLHPLLGVEEPENQLYPSLLEELAEEFRQYANRGGQVFVSTHSPDFLNAARVDEVFLLEKKDGVTSIRPAADDEQVVAYMKQGDKMGLLWKENLLNIDPA